jgi:DNA-binding transcriptional LysR family regulator
MWDAVELRELRVFLTLADELHFGRTAERLGLTQSRVSQSLRELEHKLGTQLVHRTSRRVALTASGERFRTDAGAAYAQLTGVLRSSHRTAAEAIVTLRIGLFTAASGGPDLIAIIAAFETEHPGCEVQVAELPFLQRLDPLRRGDVDLIATRLPLAQPDIVIGPILSSEPRVLMVASDHQLAERDQVSVEELTAFTVVAAEDWLPPELADAFIPRVSPTGHPIGRYRPVRDVNELITLIARGKIVHPTIPSFAASFGHSNTVSVPISDMVRSQNALAWLRRNSDPLVQEFVQIARAHLAERG